MSERLTSARLSARAVTLANASAIASGRNRRDDGDGILLVRMRKPLIEIVGRAFAVHPSMSEHEERWAQYARDQCER